MHFEGEVWWNKTPSHDKLHQAVAAPVGFLTNAIVFSCCATFAGKLVKAAGAEALALLRKPNPSIASVGVATSESATVAAVKMAQEEAIALLETLSEAEQVAQAPAIKAINAIVENPKFPQTPAIVQTSWNATLETIEKAVEYIKLTKGQDKFKHLFAEKHNFQNLLEHFGNCRETTLRAILKAASGKIPSSGVFTNFQIQVFDHIVHIQGCVIDNVPKISTCFVIL